MILVTGGAFQGKEEFIKKHWHINDDEILDMASSAASGKDSCAWSDSREHSGESLTGSYDGMPTDHIRVLVNYQDLIRQQMLRGESPEDEIKKLAARRPDIIICSNEIGMGIVPLDRQDREIREKTGRTMCLAASRADEVWRVICGIGERIK